MKALLSSTLVLILASLFATPAFASTPQTFRIGQSDFLLQTSAGQTLNENINVQNSTDTKQTLLVSFEGYKLPTDQVLNQSYLIKHNIDFATLPMNKLDIEAMASGSIPVVLTPPDTYPSGDYYGTLILKNNDETQKVNFTVRILGQLTENVEVKEISNSGDFLTFKVVNSGTISSSFSIESKLSWLTGRYKTLNSDKETIRSGEILEIKLDHGKLLPGFFQTQTSLKYGLKETVSTKLYSFWVNPEFFLVSGLTIIFSFLLYFVFKRRQV